MVEPGFTEEEEGGQWEDDGWWIFDRLRGGAGLGSQKERALCMK